MSDKKINQDIKLLLNYLWKDEERHFQECGEDTKGHIFLALKRLAKGVGYKYES